MLFILEFSSRAKKFLKKLDKQIAERIITKIERLAKDPIPSDVKFIGRDKGDMIFKYRIGDYRALYKVKNKEKTVLISRIDKRPRVYNE